MLKYVLVSVFIALLLFTLKNDIASLFSRTSIINQFDYLKRRRSQLS